MSKSYADEALIEIERGSVAYMEAGGFLSGSRPWNALTDEGKDVYRRRVGAALFAISSIVGAVPYAQLVERAAKVYFESGLPARRWDVLPESIKQPYLERIAVAIDASIGPIARNP